MPEIIDSQQTALNLETELEIGPSMIQCLLGKNPFIGIFGQTFLDQIDRFFTDIHFLQDR